jgi:hypothetical protein
MRRAFGFDLLTCSRCGGKLRPLMLHRFWRDVPHARRRRAHQPRRAALQGAK